jgi:hypothetical protein
VVGNIACKLGPCETIGVAAACTAMGSWEPAAKWTIHPRGLCTERPRPEYVIDTSEFQDVKARLAMLENRHKLDDKDSKRPTLVRKESGKIDDNGNQKADDADDRPTLRRKYEISQLQQPVLEKYCLDGMVRRAGDWSF